MGNQQSAENSTTGPMPNPDPDYTANEAPVRHSRRSASHRQTNTGNHAMAMTPSSAKARETLFMPLRPRSTASTDILETKARLTSIKLTVGEEEPITLTHGQDGPQNNLKLITQKSTNLFALQLSDGSEKNPKIVCSLENGSVCLHIALYEEVYCIDVFEANKTKLIRRWTFFMALNNGNQARAARNLWNHLLKAFTFVPPDLLKSINFQNENQRPPYDFRPSTLERRAIVNGTSIESGWSIELPRQAMNWHFDGFFARNKAKLDELEYGPVKVSPATTEPEPKKSGGRGRGRSRKLASQRGRGRGQTVAVGEHS